MERKLLTLLLTVVMMFALAIPAMAAQDDGFMDISQTSGSFSLPIVGGNAINSMTASGSPNGEGVFNGSLALVWAQNNNGERTITSNIEVVWGNYSRTGNNATQLFTVAQTCEPQSLQFSVVNNNGNTVRSTPITIPAFHIPGEQTTTVEAKCNVAGEWEIRCTLCNVLLDSGTIEALVCVPSEKNIITEAKCNAEGAWNIVCTVCSDVLDEGTIPIDPEKHNFDNGEVTDPTCTDGGFTTYTCLDCDYSYTDNAVDAAPCGNCEICNPVVIITGATNAKFVSISETSKNSRQWRLTFDVTVSYSNGTSDVVRYSTTLDGNNANLSGAFKFAADHDLAGMALTYDIKGNGSNIKEFSVR